MLSTNVDTFLAAFPLFAEALLLESSSPFALRSFLLSLFDVRLVFSVTKTDNCRQRPTDLVHKSRSVPQKSYLIAQNRNYR